MSYRELIAEEQGVDLSDQTLPTKEDYEKDLYECMACNTISPLIDFEDTEWDGDVFGICPKCGKYAMIVAGDEEDILVI